MSVDRWSTIISSQPLASRIFCPKLQNCFCLKYILKCSRGETSDEFIYLLLLSNFYSSDVRVQTSSKMKGERRIIVYGVGRSLWSAKSSRGVENWSCQSGETAANFSTSSFVDRTWKILASENFFICLNSLIRKLKNPRTRSLRSDRITLRALTVCRRQSYRCIFASRNGLDICSQLTRIFSIQFLIQKLKEIRE